MGSEFIVKLPVKILDDDSDLNNDSQDLVKRMNIEFSDIYLVSD